AQGRQRLARGRQGAGAPARGHSGEDYSDPAQSLAREPLPMLGLGPDREVFRDRVQRWLCLAGSHAAGPRHPRSLRPAQERHREAQCPRETCAAGDGDDGLMALIGRIFVVLFSFVIASLVAAVVMAIGMLLPYDWQSLASPGIHGGMFTMVVGFGFFIIA